MPTCKSCNTIFKNFAIIDGKKRNLSSREHCLDCLPFKSGRLVTEVVDSVCSTCNRSYIYNKKAGHSKTQCNSCVVNSRRRLVKVKAVDYLGGKCELCGYSKCPGALIFHHLEESDKEFQISNKLNCSWETLTKELDKCQLLCANCHQELHYIAL